MIILCMFLPPILSLKIQVRRSNLIDNSVLSHIISYFSWTMVSNILTMATILFIFKKDGTTAEAFYSFRFALFYTMINMIICLILPYINEIVRKLINVSFVIEEKKHGENDDEKKETE